jgi:hypothetical protein
MSIVPDEGGWVSDTGRWVPMMPCQERMRISQEG